MQETLSQREVAALLRGEHVRQKPTKQPPSRLEITIPIPPKETSPNARCHWAVKANAVKRQRRDAGIAAKVALMHGNYSAPEWVEAQVQATFYKSSSKAKPMDLDNALAWLKASLDSLADAGIIKNDRGLIHLPPIQRLGKDACGRNEVVLDIVGK